MVTQQAVLEFIKNRTDDGRRTGVEAIVKEFWIAPEAAAGHLRRLWRERLIEAASPRPARFRFRLEPGERIGSLSFQLAARGRRRLDWYEGGDTGHGGFITFK